MEARSQPAVALTARSHTLISGEGGPPQPQHSDPEGAHRCWDDLSFYLHSPRMTSYLYELPTTGAISFADVCEDATAVYTADIADATESRANLRAVLKESKRTDSGEKDHLKLVKVST